MGNHWNHLTELVLTSTHNLCFEQKYENIRNVDLKIFLFLVVKFSIYLNRSVFVMYSSLGVHAALYEIQGTGSFVLSCLQYFIKMFCNHFCF